MTIFYFLLSLIVVASVCGKVVVDNDDFTIWTIPDNAVDVKVTETIPGTGLIGGGSDCIEAFNWQISNANKGDFLILRASGTDAYNPFVYDLSVDTNQTLNSVTTILFKNKNGSSDKTIQSLLQNAEAIFFAGGDQNNYITFWADTPVQTIVQEKLKTVTIAGTSAGLAILGNWIYSATEGSAYSDESLENPYIQYVSIAPKLFTIPYLSTFISDTHFSARDRMGRMLTFMARIATDNSAVQGVSGMGVDEETALLLNHSTGVVTAVGKNKAFVCLGGKPAVCTPDTPLTYTDIHCTRLDALSHETYSFDTFSGQGVKYDINVVGGKYTAGTLPYGPAVTVKTK